MNGKKLAKITGATVLSAAMISGIGLKLHDNNFDHTKAVCPLAKIENILPFKYEYTDGEKYPMGCYHQLSKMTDDYNEKGIDIYPDMEQGMVPATGQTETRYFIIEDIDGNVNYKDESQFDKVFVKDGVVWGTKEVPAKEVEGYCFSATYQELEPQTLEYSAHIKRLSLKK